MVRGRERKMILNELDDCSRFDIHKTFAHMFSYEILNWNNRITLDLRDINFTSDVCI